MPVSADSSQEPARPLVVAPDGSVVRILVTGATGYVGGRLLPALLARGERVRCLARRPEAVAPRPGLEVVAGDALDAAAVRRALEGVGVAYYLIHAMGAADGFEERDRQAATLFAEAAQIDDSFQPRVLRRSGEPRGHVPIPLRVLRTRRYHRMNQVIARLTSSKLLRELTLIRQVTTNDLKTRV